jgi:hypothetical protein
VLVGKYFFSFVFNYGGIKIYPFLISHVFAAILHKRINCTKNVLMYKKENIYEEVLSLNNCCLVPSIILQLPSCYKTFVLYVMLLDCLKTVFLYILKTGFSKKRRYVIDSSKYYTQNDENFIVLVKVPGGRVHEIFYLFMIKVFNKILLFQ